MGRPLPTDIIGSPTRWLVVFDRSASSWWTSLIALGHYKHVRAFGYIFDADAYLFYDVQLGGTRLHLARGDGARALMMEWTADADVLVIEARKARNSNFRPFRPLVCTTAVAHLLGLRGALRPDAFYRQCLRHGATSVGGSHGPVHSHDQRPGKSAVEVG